MPEWFLVLIAYICGSISVLFLFKMKYRATEMRCEELVIKNYELRKMVDELSNAIDNKARELASNALRSLADDIQNIKE